MTLGTTCIGSASGSRPQSIKVVEEAVASSILQTFPFGVGRSRNKRGRGALSSTSAVSSLRLKTSRTAASSLQCPLAKHIVSARSRAVLWCVAIPQDSPLDGPTGGWRMGCASSACLPIHLFTALCMYQVGGWADGQVVIYKHTCPGVEAPTCPPWALSVASGAYPAHWPFLTSDVTASSICLSVRPGYGTAMLAVAPSACLDAPEGVVGIAPPLPSNVWLFS